MLGRVHYKGTKCGRACQAFLDKMTDGQLLSGLKNAEATVEATRAVLQSMIGELRRRAVSWEAVGKALGISRQAAWERFS